jgi:EAL and modified HD-GYP domain-containing signal transduction protein
MVSTTLPATPDAPAQPAAAARLPLYDRTLAVRAYELVADDVAALPLDQLVGDRLALVAAPPSAGLPPERVVLRVTDVAAAVRARAARYAVVVDADADDELVALARVVRVDAGALDDAELETIVRRLRPHGPQLLAVGLEDYDAFDRCKRAGFDLFGGSFFRTPRASGDEIPAGRLSRLQLMAALQDPNVELEELEAIIERDVGLSYRLLRAVNSGFLFLANRISSIHDALVRLGQRAVRQWSTLIVLADCDDRPSELLVTALVRARLCELSTQARGGDAECAFTVGLFSVVDAFMDAPMEEIVARLPFDEEVAAALLRREGNHGAVLAATVDYEGGRFDTAETRLPGIPLRSFYLDAVQYAETTSGSLRALR